MTEFLTTREVAELADVPVRVVDKAVEEGIVAGVRHVVRAGKKRRMFPLHFVPYAAVVKRLPVRLSLTQKKALARALAKRAPEGMTEDSIEVAPAVSIDLPRLVGSDLAQKAYRYAQGREEHIETNPDILGGTPVIKGTRLNIYSLLGRVCGGDKVEAILDDHPGLSRDALETALLYARSHPLVGRPLGRPWKAVA